MLFFIFKITEWCNRMVGYSEMLNRIWNKCKMHLVVAALLLWFSLKHKVFIFPSDHIWSGTGGK